MASPIAMAEADAEKRLRAVKKKLAQIDKLKEKGDLDADQQDKVAGEAALLQEVAELEAVLAGAGGATDPRPPAAQPSGGCPSQPAEKPKAAAKPKSKPAAAPPVAEEPTAEAESLSPMEVEKRLKAIKKKLGQIAKLKEKGGDLDADARDKVASQAELLREADCLERGVPFVPAVPPKAEAAPAAEDAPAEGEAEAAEAKDPHAAARAEALQPPPADLGLLIDDETEKRFKSLQKKLRDIGKLWERDKLDKLQERKLEEEPKLMEELGTIRAKADRLVAERRERVASMGKKPKQQKQPVDDDDDDDGEDAGPAPEEDDEDDDEAEEKPTEEKKKKKTDFVNQDLKTGRQKKAADAAKSGSEYLWPQPSSASWPEVKEVLESGDCGVDRSRIKKAIVIDHPKPGEPYGSVDSTLLKCFFLTRMELKLPPGVLAQEAFSLYFPGTLAEGLLEVILKGNGLEAVPPGLQDLQRIRSVDLSHNRIASLPDEKTWDSVAASLEMLDLSFNQVTSIEELAPLYRLSMLKIDGNKITSLEGISWGQQKQLVTLSAVGNEITALPEAVGETGSLEHIELSENKITAIPVGLCELKKLKLFNVAGNPIKDKKAMAASEKGIKDLKAYLTKVGGGKKK